MTRISSVFNLLKQVGFAVLVLGAIVEIRAQGACEVRGPYDRCEVFERIKERIATDPWVLKGDAGEGGLQDDIWDWQVHSKGEVTQEMIDLLRTLADDPEVDGRIRVSAVWALELSEPEEELDRMRHLSKTAPPSIAVPAAAQLVRWGHWDDGSETLLRFGSWQQLAYSADEMHAMPILVAASWDTTRTGLSRIHAASAMRTYGDTLTFFAVARRILSEYLLEGKPCKDLGDLGRCLDSVGLAFERAWDTTDTRLFVAGLNYPVTPIQRQCVYILGQRGRAFHDRTAAEALCIASIQCADPEVREDAAEQFMTLPKWLRESE